MSKEYIEALLDLKEKQYRGYLSDDEYVEKINKILDDYVIDYNRSSDNAKPSEALECLENWKYQINSYIDCSLECGDIDNECYNHLIEELEQYYTTIKQALLKAQEQEKENANLKGRIQFSEKEYNNLMEDKDNLESELFKQQQPKQYLKWEDLEFSEETKGLNVKMNNNDYILRYTLDVFGGKCCFLYDSARNHHIVLTRQFFNDLHLERVEE